MTKEQKQAYVENLVSQLRTIKAAVFTEYRGTSVAQMEQLRTQLYDKGISYRIAKNSLVKRALDEVGIQVSDLSVLDQPVAIAMSSEDEVVAAKAIAQANKEFETVIPLAGIVNGQFVPKSVIMTLATLPGREELYGKMVGSLAGLPTRMVRTIANPIQGLVTALGQLKTQKEA